MKNRCYLDYNATAPVRPEVMDAVLEALGVVGNASSVHGEGREAHGVLERARERVAALLGADPEDVVFTSGGTEANNLALAPTTFPTPPEGRTWSLFRPPTEHPSVLQAGRFTPESVHTIPVDQDGRVLPAQLADLLDAAGFTPEREAEPFLVSVMLANNETGVLQPVAELAPIVHARGGLLHTDVVQAVGKIPVDVTRLGADLLSLSAHKIGGPQGVGALVIPGGRAAPPWPLIAGGGQERGFRGGTENLPGIAGFGMAAEVARQELAEMERVRALRDALEKGLKAVAPEVVIFGANAPRLPNTTSFGLAGMRAESTLISLDLSDVAVSAGAACSSGKVKASHVLLAMGVGEELAESALRVSLGWASRIEEVDCFLSAWTAIYEKHKARRSAA